MRWRLSVVHGGLQRQKADLPNNRTIEIEPAGAASQGAGAGGMATR